MSSAFYTRVATAFNDGFFYLQPDPLHTPVTGKVQGDFTLTLSKNGIGNQSTTGVTITEVSSSTNPGEYQVALSASSFVAATGFYVLRIKDTVSTQYSWEQGYFVTSDGTGAGTAGPAAFTAVAANGRVVISGIATPNATVVVRASSGALYATAITDASGLWGTVYFPASSGTYTIYVILTGYQQVTGTIVVSGSVATGPGTDLSLTTATSTSGFLAADLWSYARRASRNATSPQATTEQQQAVTEAMEMNAKAHRWTWYLRKAQFTLNGAYTAGVATLTNGSTTVTLTTGAWPSWAANAKLYVLGQIIRISTRSSGTVALIEAAWADTTQTLVSVVVFQDELALPSDMYQFGKLLPGPRWGAVPVMVGAEQMYDAQNAVNFSLKFPSLISIIKQSLAVWPYPTSDLLVSYTYWARPATLATANDTADWDPAHIEVLHRAIDYQIAVRFGGFAGGSADDAFKRWEIALAEAVANNREANTDVGLMGMPTPSSQLIWQRR